MIDSVFSGIHRVCSSLERAEPQPPFPFKYFTCRTVFFSHIWPGWTGHCLSTLWTLSMDYIRWFVGVPMMYWIIDGSDGSANIYPGRHEVWLVMGLFDDQSPGIGWITSVTTIFIRFWFGWSGNEYYIKCPVYWRVSRWQVFTLLYNPATSGDSYMPVNYHQGRNIRYVSRSIFSK